MGDEGLKTVRFSTGCMVRALDHGEYVRAEVARELQRQRDGLREALEETHVFLNNWLGDFGDQGGRIVRRMKDIDAALVACEPAPATASTEGGLLAAAVKAIALLQDQTFQPDSGVSRKRQAVQILEDAIAGKESDR